MKQPNGGKLFGTYGAVALEGALSTLAKSNRLQSRLREEFGADEFPLVLSMLKSAKLDGSLGDRVHDFLSDAFINECEIAWSGTTPGTEFDYFVRVNSYGGVYFVWAAEFDPVGYFLSVDDAKSYVYLNWEEVRDDEPKLKVSARRPKRAKP